MKYNGWTNKATWLAYIWHGDSLSDMQAAGENITAYYAQRIITDWVDDMQEPLDGFVRDMLNTAMSSINWDELANHYKHK